MFKVATNLHIRMPSYQVNDGSESYGRNGSYNNYGYRQETSGGTAMRERDLDKPPAYNGKLSLIK